MIVDSFKFKGKGCFKNSWAGLDVFKPINVIIGRNNSGKSQLLDVLELLTKHSMHQLKMQYQCSGILDESTLRRFFPERQESRELNGDHWFHHGRQYVDKEIEWQSDGQGSSLDLTSCNHPAPNPQDNPERIRRILKSVSAATNPIHACIFRRLLADRDIQPEIKGNTDTVSTNGTGATDLIRRILHSNNPKFNEELIRKEVLDALSKIYGTDGSFSRICAQEDESRNLWEVYLDEPKKGVIPLSDSGSGLKTVILVLLNLIVIPALEEIDKSKFVFAFEELENNLHPALLRRLFDYLTTYVKQENCTLFLTTHSNVALDYFGSLEETQIIHVSHDGESAHTKTVSAHFDQVSLLTELGSRPSDLLQANGVIWLEGPSDRIYFNRFIEIYSDGELREGRDYQCVFYGGSVLANSSFQAPEGADDTFANLLRLNNNVAVICDGDRTADSGAGSRIKGRVQRISQEVSNVPNAFLWITSAKEIENYVPGEVWASVYELESVPNPGPYDRFPSRKLEDDDFVKTNLKRKSFDKCDFAMDAVPLLKRENLKDRFELEVEMMKLVQQIKLWNK